MDRRDFLVGILQALFLALFPWLRTERGAEVVRAAIDQAVPKGAIFKSGEFRLSMGVKGYEIPPEFAAHLRAIMRGNPEFRKLALPEVEA